MQKPPYRPVRRAAVDGDNSARRTDWIDVVADPVRLHILRALSRVPNATAADLASSGSMSGQTVRRHLDALVVLGVIEAHEGASDGETPGRPPARYSLSSALREGVVSVLGGVRSSG